LDKRYQSLRCNTPRALAQQTLAPALCIFRTALCYLALSRLLKRKLKYRREAENIGEESSLQWQPEKRETR